MTSGKKYRITNRQIVLGIVIVLLLTAAAALWYRASDGPTEVKDRDGYSITITRDGETIKTYTLSQLKEMPAVTVHASLESSQQGHEEGDFKGVLLSSLLEQTDESLLEQCQTFVCTAGDGFASALTKGEVKKAKDLIVAYEKDGKALLPLNKGGGGPMRLVIASDTYGNRSTKFLVEIECR